MKSRKSRNFSKRYECWWTTRTYVHFFFNMLVSFVQAGLLNLTQSMGVILGADIGTTIVMHRTRQINSDTNFAALHLHRL